MHRFVLGARVVWGLWEGVRGWVGCSRALLMQCEGKVLPKILYSSIDFTEIIFCPTNVICEDFVL